MHYIQRRFLHEYVLIFLYKIIIAKYFYNTLNFFIHGVKETSPKYQLIVQNKISFIHK